MFKLLTMGNPKVMKGQKRGYLTYILHLAPASLSGFNVCPMATQGCIAACLNTAGRGGIPTATPVMVDGESFANHIQAARVRRTRHYFNNRVDFMDTLSSDIAKAIKHAAKLDLIPVFRLNGTSDIRWERVAVGPWANIMARFPDVQFYDYTKISNRRDLPRNYHLTFSLAENNDQAAREALANGLNVAAVFKLPKSQPMPTTWCWPLGSSHLPVPVFNGDDSDLRFLDPKGVIVGLYAKGKAKRDTTGFVRAI